MILIKRIFIKQIIIKINLYLTKKIKVKTINEIDIIIIIIIMITILNKRIHTIIRIINRSTKKDIDNKL